MARQRDLDKLLSDLRSFLLILDRESLSSVARDKKKSVAELLSRLQSPSSERGDAEYMIMRCLSPSPQGQPSPGARRMDATGGRTCECHTTGTLSPHGGSKVPGVSQSPPADDSYEDAEPLGPSRCSGEHHNASPPRHPHTPSTLVPARLSGGADTDSSHYESYEEDEEGVKDRAHYLRRPPGTGRDAEPSGRPEAQLCGFLWRKRWLGQWAKQLFIVREHVLLCFRYAADPQPVLELDLRGCHVTCKAKQGRKMPHTLKVTGTAGEVLVIGFQSRQQAEDWRKVIEEVSSNAPGGLASISTPSPPSSRLSRAGKEEEEDCSRQSHARSPRAGEDAKGGFLSVRLRGRWQRLWCAVRQGVLRMVPEPGSAQHPGCALRLEGCEVTPGTATGSPQRLRIRIAQRGRELALLQTRSDEEREAWLKTLQARGGAEPASNSPHDEKPRLGNASSCPAAGGLLQRRVPTPNAYMDDPFGQLPPAEAPKYLYSNMERLQQLQNLDRAVQGQRRRPVSALPMGACSSTLHAAPAAALRSRAASPQWVKVSSDLWSKDLSQSQRTLTLPERKGTRDGLDILIGRAAEGLCSCAGWALSFPKADGVERCPGLAVPPCPCREKSLPEAGGEGGAAGESLPHEGQAEGWLRDEPAGHRHVPEGPHRCHQRLGWLRAGLVPHAAAEAHGIGQERPEAVTTLPAHGGEGKCAAEEKGVGDEVCDVIGTAAASGHPSTERRLHVDRAGPAWCLVLTININATTTHIYFLYIYIYTYKLSIRGSEYPWNGWRGVSPSQRHPLLTHPKTLVLGHKFPHCNLTSCWFCP
ncbi:actin filament-associated protein 1-like 2 isoform X3 [Pezoporus flaviventris]|uniref:actin filament-associated protein 1-like 2 isoform X3 n=1 Tax=Pezoporus flaviventris TaxID=889875 RepID=UPI002AAFD8A1|nr:actin filament-associated protein 1-like 2 isoform X3 [Pezoporus flaviventris]